MQGITISSGEEFDSFTHYLYLVLIFMTFLLSSRKRRSVKGYVLFLPLLILWIFAVTRDYVGADYEPYYSIFNGAYYGGYASSNSTIEPGFYYLNVLLNFICSYEYFGFMFFHFVILFLTYKSVTYFKNDISFPYAMLAYMVLWYFLSFNLLRICLAASIVSYSIRYLLEKRYWMYFFIILLTFNIHMSSILMVIPAFLYIVYQRYPKITYIGLGILFIIINGSIDIITQYIGIERYQDYLEMESGTGIGLNLIFTYLPFIFWLWLGKKYVNKQLWELCLVFTIFAFIVDFSGYRIIFLGRLRCYAVVPFIIYLPVLIMALQKAPRWIYVNNCIAIFLYLIVKYYLFLPQLYWADEIMPYKSLIL